MKKGTHPTNRPKVSLSEKMGTVMHQDRSGGDHAVAIPDKASNWNQLPQEVRDALFNEAFGKTKRLKRRLDEN